jgi:hypothetical protein
MSSGERERLVVIGQVASKVLRQEVAAKRLGLCVRQAKGLVRTYRERGGSGPVSRQRRLASNRLDAGVLAAQNCGYDFRVKEGLGTLLHELIAVFMG